MAALAIAVSSSCAGQAPLSAPPEAPPRRNAAPPWPPPGTYFERWPEIEPGGEGDGLPQREGVPQAPDSQRPLRMLQPLR